MMKHRTGMSVSLLLALALATAQFGCGGGSPASTPPSDSAGAAASGAGDHQATGQTWGAVSDQVTYCDYPSCPGQDVFTVGVDGKYYVGDPNSPKATGTLTSSELNALGTAAQAVANQSLAAQPACTQRQAQVGATEYSEAMALTDGTVVIIADVSSTQVCYNGDPNLAKELRAQLETLEKKYDPGQGAGTTTGAMPPGSVGSSGASGY